MTKLKPYSKNSIKRGPLLKLSFFLIITCLICGCSSSTAPTFQREEIAEAIQNIATKEFKLNLKVKLVGQTLWVYMPVADLMEKADKPTKFFEKFAIKQNDLELRNGLVKVDYAIKSIPEKEQTQEYKYSKAISEKINGIWNVIRRVLFSMNRSQGLEPKFICLIISDIKNGFEIREICYYQDLKKISYSFVSPEEYQHRSIQDFNLHPQIIGDTEGSHINYSDITLEDFIIKQIQYRIKLKFQKPEVDKNADIDKEIIKIIEHTIKTYGFKDFNRVELNNADTNRKTFLSEAAIWERAAK